MLYNKKTKITIHLYILTIGRIKKAAFFTRLLTFNPTKNTMYHASLNNLHNVQQTEIVPRHTDRR